MRRGVGGSAGRLGGVAEVRRGDPRAGRPSAAIAATAIAPTATITGGGHREGEGRATLHHRNAVRR
jgi:hypothetical protein